MNHRKVLGAGASAGLFLLAAANAGASVVAFFDLNDIQNPTISTTQFETGNNLVYNADLQGWQKSGFHAVHAIQLSGEVNGGQGNYAIMIFSDNFITMEEGFAANEAGVTYYVSYDVGPTVYADSGQVTTIEDALRINLLRDDDSILATNDVLPGAWAGEQTFTRQYFSYVGDGTGDLRIQMRSADPLSGRFSGAVDNMAFWTSVPTAVPEPSFAVLGLCAGAFALGRRRRG